MFRVPRNGPPTGRRTRVAGVALVAGLLAAAAHSPPNAGNILQDLGFFSFPVCYAGESPVNVHYARTNGTYNSYPYRRMFKEYSVCTRMPPFANRATYIYALGSAYQYCCYYPPATGEVFGSYSPGRYWAIGEARDCYGNSDCFCYPDLFFAHAWSCGYFGSKYPEEGISYGGPNDGGPCDEMNYILL